jgi:mannose-1-phosphate guanylyltransferase/mannose-6-phosphate isomerase
MAKLVPVILCGGSGTRLWPYSRSQTPKQFLKLIDNSTLLQKTARRALEACADQQSDVVVVTLSTHADEVARQLEEVSPRLTRHILSEPSAQNTAAALALAMLYIEKNFGNDALIWVLPSDHHIGEECILREAMSSGRALAEEGYLVTFGIEPTRPESGYGYIRKGRTVDGKKIFDVMEFIEKPTREIAEEYVASGDYYWSSGMHLLKVSSGLESYDIYAPEILEAVKGSIKTSSMRPAPDLYKTIEKQPFETAVLEKAEKIVVVSCDPKWSDIGSWESLWEIRNKDTQGNILEGPVYCEDVENSMIIAKKRLVTCVGLKDIIIIEMDDAVLVADKRSNASLKKLVERLAQSKRKEIVGSKTKEYVWGRTRNIVDNKDMRIVELTVKPRHSAEQEYDGGMSNLCIVEGKGHISYGKGSRDVTLNSGEEMPVYRITNDGTDDLVIMMITQKKAHQEDRDAGDMVIEPAQTPTPWVLNA